MATEILIAAIVILVCLSLTRLSNKIGLPTLAVFIGLGMLFGSDGLLKIPFDNYVFAEKICSISLIFIMFYGGFGTNWRQARSTAAISILLSSLGVVITAMLTGLFCRFVLGMGWLQGMLIGAVISSTDAASVFSILRSRRLNLKYSTASLLEVESGSNDPCAYMLTVIVLTLLGGKADGDTMTLMLLKQIAFGGAVGVAMAYVSRFLLAHLRFGGDGYDSMLIFGMALLSYASATQLGGNGYLSVYITGIMLGNMPIHSKKTLVHFFDGITGLMQILIFFLLGLLSFPSQLPEVALSGLLIALFITFVARPAAVFAIMSPFRCPVNQKILVSWAGLRGAASIVFAIVATVDPVLTPSALFNTVFFIVLFSIIIQGSLIPRIARGLDMIDDNADVMKTFSDYSDETPIQFIRLSIDTKHPWAKNELRDVKMIPGTRVAMIIRGSTQLIPRGHTMILPGDSVIVSGPALEGDQWGALKELHIDRNHSWCNLPLHSIDMADHQTIIMIRRGRRTIIPEGKTVLRDGDVLVVNG